MAYTPTTWANREVEKPRTYIMTDNGDGTITLTPSEGEVFVAGTPLDAVNLNKMEAQIAANDANKVNKAGDTMTGNLTAQIIDATTTLREAGVNLNTKYQAKGDYMPIGRYISSEFDPNGMRINVGNYADSGKPIILYLTSAQPAASPNEHRVWIQIDNF